MANEQFIFDDSIRRWVLDSMTDSTGRHVGRDELEQVALENNDTLPSFAFDDESAAPPSPAEADNRRRRLAIEMAVINHNAGEQ